MSDIESPPIPKAAPRPVRLTFDGVSIEVCTKGKGRKLILDEVSGSFGPAELVAVMGPSGSGKTTLLNSLTGVTTPTSGTISVNGSPYDRRTMRHFATFVPQDDLLTPSLTVHESLAEACLFKMGRSATAADRRARCEELLAQFGLAECRDVLVGHPEGKKGISGGQKRRLSVALELAGRPSLLLLDEPTSGLDSVSAMALVRLLRSLSQSMAVVATIHQPSAAAFYMFDRLLLLHRGAVCYQGPISHAEQQPVRWFAAAGFACPPLDNPADFFFEVLAGSPEAVRAHYLRQPIAREPTGAALEALTLDGPAYAATLRTQMRALILRNARAIRREPLLAKLRFVSATVIGLVMGVLYFDTSDDLTGVNDTISLILFSMLFLAIINALPVVLSVLPELAVVRKEVRNNWYNPATFVPAKLVVETPFLVLPPLLYLAIAGTMSGFALGDGGSRFFQVYLAILLVVFATHAWALMICSVAPDSNTAVLLAPGSIMPMAVLSGFFKNQQDMTWVFRWATYVDYLSYSWQAMANAAFRGKVFTGDAASTPYATGEKVLENRLRLPNIVGGESYDVVANYWANVGVLLAFVLVFRLLAIIFISRRLSS